MAAFRPPSVSGLINFFHFLAFLSLSLPLIRDSVQRLCFDSLFDAPGSVWGSQIGQSAYPGQEPGLWGQAQGQRSHRHLPTSLPSSINYPPSAFHHTIAVPTLITWKQAKHPGPGERGLVNKSIMCVRAAVFERLFAWDTQNCLLHTHPDPDQPTIPTLLSCSHPLVSHTHPLTLTPTPQGSFWFPFWFLTSGAISGWPAVPLILPAHCVASWAGPWAPGAGRGARNGLVPVAVLVKGTVAPFPLVHHNCFETDFRAIFVETATSL